MITKTLTVFDDNDDEILVELPAHFKVCSRCEGHGTHLNPSIGDHAYTAEEFDESFDDEGRAQYFQHGGIYDVTCEECNGDRVTLEIDRDKCTTPDLQHALALYDRQIEDDYNYRREVEAERRMGC